MNRRLCLALAALAVILAATPFPAVAQGYGSPRGRQALSLWGVFDAGGPGGIGAGLRLTLPIAPQGVLRHPTIKDEFVLEPGVDFVYYHATVGYYPYPLVDYSWSGVLPVVGVAWNVWFSDRFAVYPKLDLGYWFGWWSGWTYAYGYYRPTYGGFFIQGALGVIYRLGTVGLRAELGTGLLRLGVAFQF